MLTILLLFKSRIGREIGVRLKICKFKNALKNKESIKTTMIKSLRSGGNKITNKTTNQIDERAK